MDIHATTPGFRPADASYTLTLPPSNIDGEEESGGWYVARGPRLRRRSEPSGTSPDSALTHAEVRLAARIGFDDDLVVDAFLERFDVTDDADHAVRLQLKRI